MTTDHRLTPPDTPAGSAPYLAATVASALAIASRAVISDIESEGIRIGPPGARRWDVRPMLDEREHSPELIDQASEAIAFALAMGLVVQDLNQPHLLLILGTPA